MDSTAHINTDLVSFGYSESTYVMTDYALHCHNFYEVFYFLSGDADYLVEGVNYQPTPGSFPIAYRRRKKLHIPVV